MISASDTGTRDTRREPLTRAEIARAALVMVDRDGGENLSMRRLAQELRVTTMAVYHHFESKAEVMQAAADQVWIEVVLSVEPHDDPVETILQGFLTARRVFRAHRDITPYAVASPRTPDAVHAMASAIAAQFEQAGFTGERAATAYHALATFTLGSGLLEAQRAMVDRSIRAPVSDLAAAVGTPTSAGADDDTYTAVLDSMEDDPDLVRFERSLRAIMAGLRAADAT